MKSFRQAVEANDHMAIEALLAEDVVFTSPVAFKPYPGKAITAAILRGVSRVFTDFRYVREITGEDGRDHALVFEARVGDRAITGCDFLHLNEHGLIDDFMVMVRPLSAAQALAEAMGAQFGRIAAEAAQAAEFSEATGAAGASESAGAAEAAGAAQADRA
ncbi:nuclear transport factor 2 family protein [Streptomyces tanashiensis]|uniref:nuclear transport factor 2 family protein n=1 Tax=Streptomyces tanashiensis TaxID=67367 RepID=UPI0033FF29B9